MVSKTPNPRICNDHIEILSLPVELVSGTLGGTDIENLTRRHASYPACRCRILGISRQHPSPEQLCLAYPADYEKLFQIPRSITGAVRSYKDPTTENMGRTENNNGSHYKSMILCRPESRRSESGWQETGTMTDICPEQSRYVILELCEVCHRAESH